VGRRIVNRRYSKSIKSVIVGVVSGDGGLQRRWGVIREDGVVVRVGGSVVRVGGSVVREGGSVVREGGKNRIFGIIGKIGYFSRKNKILNNRSKPNIR
jgi:hypothetical protein